MHSYSVICEQCSTYNVHKINSTFYNVHFVHHTQCTLYNVSVLIMGRLLSGGTCTTVLSRDGKPTFVSANGTLTMSPGTRSPDFIV